MSSAAFPSPYEACIRACQKCLAVCEAGLAAVNESALPPAWRQAGDLCRSAVRICRVAVDELTLGSAVIVPTCALCAVICRACAEECALLRGATPWPEIATACQQAVQECHAVAVQPARVA